MTLLTIQLFVSYSNLRYIQVFNVTSGWSYYLTLMTGPEGNSEFCFPRISTLRFKGLTENHTLWRELPVKRSHLLQGQQNSLTVPQGTSHKVICYIANKTKANFEKCAEIPATTLGHLWSHATAVNILRVTVNCFPFYIIHVVSQCCTLMALGRKQFHC